MRCKLIALQAEQSATAVAVSTGNQHTSPPPPSEARSRPLRGGFMRNALLRWAAGGHVQGDVVPADSAAQSGGHIASGAAASTPTAAHLPAPLTRCAHAGNITQQHSASVASRSFLTCRVFPICEGLAQVAKLWFAPLRRGAADHPVDPAVDPLGPVVPGPAGRRRRANCARLRTRSCCRCSGHGRVRRFAGEP